MILDKELSNKEKAKKLGEELARLKKERSAFEGTWKEAQELVTSTVLSFDVTEGSSTKGYNIPKRLTNRPANYQETLVAGLCGYAVNPNIVWMKLGLSDQDVMKAYGVKDWLEGVELSEYEEFDNLNFYPEMKIVIEQATTFGFGILFIEEDIVNAQVRFRQIDAPEVFLDTNEYNEYETVFRRFFMSVENAVSRFGIEKMSQSIKEQWDIKDGTGRNIKEIEILHAVFRRKNKKGVSERNTEMPFASFFVDMANDHIIEESGYDSFPYAIFVWDRIGGMKYPISPAIKAINDVKLLHKTEDTRLTVAQMSAKEPIAIPESMRSANHIFGSDGYIRPGAIIYYDKNQNDGVPTALNMGGNYPITLEITQQQAANIKDWFYVDFFLMLQQQNIHQMTATAVQALQGEKAAVMTNMITNLKSALQVVVKRSFDIMLKQSRFKDMPQALVRAGGSRMKFTFSSVLSQIQQAALRYQGAQAWLPTAQAVAQLGQAYPPALDALDRFDFDILLQNEARASSMPETAIREDEDVKAIQAQRAQAQEAQNQMAMRQQAQAMLAQNYNKLNEPPKAGSPAEALFSQGVA